MIKHLFDNNLEIGKFQFDQLFGINLHLDQTRHR